MSIRPNPMARHLAILAAGSLALGCTKPLQVKSYQDPLSGADSARASAAGGRDGASDGGPVPAAALDELRANFERVHFAYDSSELDEPTRSVLDRNAAILQRYPSIRVDLEGHCDDRGSTDYNLALGERRSSSVYDYLLRLGVAAGQLNKVSFGEERPLDAAESESAWSENRRVEFVATVVRR